MTDDVDAGNIKTKFQRMEPVEVHDGATKYLNWVMEHVGKLWGSEGGAQTGTVEDIVESSPHPAHIMTLAQFRELCLDTGITCRDVLFASIGRQVSAH